MLFCCNLDLAEINEYAAAPTQPRGEYPRPRYYFRIGNVSVYKVIHYSDTESASFPGKLAKTAELTAYKRAAS